MSCSNNFFTFSDCSGDGVVVWVPLVFICLTLFLPLAANSKDTSPGDTQISQVFFPEPAYTFDTSVEGKMVFHDFIVQNKGKKTLEIQKVNTG